MLTGDIILIIIIQGINLISVSRLLNGKWIISYDGIPIWIFAWEFDWKSFVIGKSVIPVYLIN